MKAIAFTIILFAAVSVYPTLAKAGAYQVETAHLKSFISTSACVMVRNGVQYNGSEVITHINRKEAYFKKEIKTTEDFIRLAATKSEISGKKYTVHCDGRKPENLGDWLQKELTDFRQNHVNVKSTS